MAGSGSVFGSEDREEKAQKNIKDGGSPLRLRESVQTPAPHPGLEWIRQYRSIHSRTFHRWNRPAPEARQGSGDSGSEKVTWFRCLRLWLPVFRLGKNLYFLGTK